MQSGNSSNPKTDFLSLYHQLDYDYQCIILNTFKCLVSYKDKHEKGYKPFDVAGVLKLHQEKLDYSDQKVSDKVNEILEDESIDAFLDVGTYRRIKKRNTQTSKSTTTWLKWLAQALEFEEREYKKLTDEGYEHAQKLITQHSQEVNRIETLYDLLSEKEKRAIFQLTTSLLQLHCVADFNAEDLSTEYLELQEENESQKD